MPSHTDSGLQRVGPLARLPAILTGRGIALADVLEGLNVTPEQLRPEVQLPIAVISDIVDRAARLADMPALGLAVAEAQNHQILGPAGQLMACCETLGSALGTFAAVQLANSTAAAVYLHPVGEDYALGFGIYAPELASSHIYDASAAMGFNIVRDLTGGAVQPLEVLMSRPPPTDPDPWRRYFRCPVRFDEGQTCLILPGRGMGFRLPGANAAQREALLTALQRQLSTQPMGFAARVKHALRPLLLAGAASQTQVAAHLNVHPRTLGRRLEQENATFEQIKDEVRQAVAKELLARTGIAVCDVAVALGYATPSAFVRAFRRWAGVTPTAWRRRIQPAIA